MSTTVLLVDDHELIRQGLARAFERDDEMTVVGQAGTVAEGVAACDEPPARRRRHRPAAARRPRPRRRARDPRDERHLGLVVLTMHAGDDQIFAAMEAGASAFVGKDSKATEVVSAAKHAAVAPRTFLCAGLSAAMMRRATAPAPPTALRRGRRRCSPCSPTAWAPARSPASLYISESTAKTHITHIYQKLGAANRAQALVTAMRLGSARPRSPRSASDLRRSAASRGSRRVTSGASHKGLPIRGRSPDSTAPRSWQSSPRRVLVGSEPGLITHTHKGNHHAREVHHLHAHAGRDEEKGATAVEYGLMVALIAVAIITSSPPSAARPVGAVHGRRHRARRQRPLPDPSTPGPAPASCGAPALRSFSSAIRRRPAHEATAIAAARRAGATAVEYGLMVGCIAVAIIVAVTAFGCPSRDLFLSPGRHVRLVR